MSITAEPTSTADPGQKRQASPVWAWLVILVAGLAALGGFYLSFVEGKFPCPLCFYQRAFALGVFGVMLLGVLGGLNSRVALATLALPLGIAGLGVALWHVQLERTGALSCPPGAFGISTAPQQSLLAFGLICALLLLDAYQPGRPGNSLFHGLGGVALGAVLACGCIFFNPQPKRPIPAEEYEGTPRICLPPRPAK